MKLPSEDIRCWNLGIQAWWVKKRWRRERIKEVTKKKKKNKWNSYGITLPQRAGKSFKWASVNCLQRLPMKKLWPNHDLQNRLKLPLFGTLYGRPLRSSENVAGLSAHFQPLYTSSLVVVGILHFSGKQRNTYQILLGDPLIFEDLPTIRTSGSYN